MGSLVPLIGCLFGCVFESTNHAPALYFELRPHGSDVPALSCIGVKIVYQSRLKRGQNSLKDKILKWIIDDFYLNYESPWLLPHLKYWVCQKNEFYESKLYTSHVSNLRIPYYM